MNKNSYVQRHVQSGLVVAMLLAGALLVGCGSESSSAGKASQAATPAAKPISAHYVLTFPGEDEYRAFFDVVTAGERRIRMSFTVRSDVPITIYRWVWDGRRVLEYGNESDPPSYSLYEAPAEHQDMLRWVTSWIVGPRSDDFARECPDAQPIDAARTIAGRQAIGFHCVIDRQKTTLWIDEETSLLLSQNRIPGEGYDNGVLLAEQVSADPPIDKTTFSTDPPPGAKVDVIPAQKPEGE